MRRAGARQRGRQHRARRAAARGPRARPRRPSDRAARAPRRRRAPCPAAARGSAAARSPARSRAPDQLLGASRRRRTAGRLAAGAGPLRSEHPGTGTAGRGAARVGGVGQHGAVEADQHARSALVRRRWLSSATSTDSSSSASAKIAWRRASSLASVPAASGSERSRSRSLSSKIRRRPAPPRSLQRVPIGRPRNGREVTPSTSRSAKNKARIRFWRVIWRWGDGATGRWARGERPDVWAQ